MSYPNPGATVSPEIADLDLPLKTDPYVSQCPHALLLPADHLASLCFSFYIATDERNATFVAHMRENGAVFVSDLLTAEDRMSFPLPSSSFDCRLLSRFSVLLQDGSSGRGSWYLRT